MLPRKPILHYFDGRGRAEIIRLTLVAIGQEWEPRIYSERVDYENLLASNKMLFQQMPLVEFEDKNIIQSFAIVRFFARKGDLMGCNPDEEVKIDQLFEGTRDCYSFLSTYGFEGWQEVLDKAKTAPTALPRYLPIFEKVLKENGSNGFLVGSKLSVADIGLFENVLTIEELIGNDFLAPYPEIQNFSKNMKSNERLAKYLGGPLRPRKNDERYIDDIKTVLCVSF